VKCLNVGIGECLGYGRGEMFEFGNVGMFELSVCEKCLNDRGFKNSNIQ